MMPYPHLNGNEKISESYTRINDNFDGVDAAATAHKTAATLDHPDSSVTTSKLAPKTVTQAKIGDKAVGTGQIGDKAVGAGQIADKAIGTGQIADGAATDAIIGNRTISDTSAPTGDTAVPTTLFGWLAYMIKSITGGATWRTLPGMTIAAIKAILDAAVSAATANTLMKRDANGRAQVAAPSAAADIARKDTVDAVQSNLTTHTGDTTVHITGAERTTWNNKVDKVAGKQLSTEDYTTAEKTKLAGIAASAEVNQNAFTTIAVSGQSSVEADSKTDTLTLAAGTGITITTDPATDKVTVTATGTATPGVHASSHLTGGSDPIAKATTTTDGLMSGPDKTRLDGAQAKKITTDTGDVTIKLTAASDDLLASVLAAGNGLHTLYAVSGCVNNPASSSVRGTAFIAVSGSNFFGWVKVFDQSNNVEYCNNISGTSWKGWLRLETTGNKNVANGYAGLDALGLIATAQLPAIQKYQLTADDGTGKGGFYNGDLNALIEPGIYSTTAATINMPLAVTSITKVYKRSGNPAHAEQCFTSTASSSLGRTFNRVTYDAGATWSTWEESARVSLAQMKKITNDNGGYLYSLTASTDDLLATAAATSGLCTYYATNVVINVPSTKSVRCLSYQYGGGPYGWIMAVDSAGQVFFNYNNGSSSGGWTGWTTVETTTGSQAKATAAIAAAATDATTKSNSAQTAAISAAAADATTKANAAETNAKNASFPRSGGTLTGNITINNSNPAVIIQPTADIAGTTGMRMKNAAGTDQFIFGYSSLNNRVALYDYTLPGTSLAIEGGSALDSAMTFRGNRVYHAGNVGPFYKGSGSPEGSVTAPVGSIYQRTDGGAASTLYVKESGTGNTGWRAVQTA